MATLVTHIAAPSSYKDHQFKGTQQDWTDLLNRSCTLYVGNLSFYTTEEQIYEIFSKCGEIKRVVMGLDRVRKTPCGFCFVEYYTHDDAVSCMKYINGTRLDERVIRTDLDPGFREGRQFGRGKSGGQVRDEYRQEFDPGRGGWGQLKAQEEMKRSAHPQQEQEQQQEQQQITSDTPGSVDVQPSTEQSAEDAALHTDTEMAEQS